MLLLVAVLALTACGTQTPAQKTAKCLNAKGFLVQASGLRVEGTAPDGVAFTVVALTGTINDNGNPGKRQLSLADRSSIRACLN